MKNHARFIGIAFMLTSFFVLSCKHDTQNNTSKNTDSITVTVQKDEHVTKCTSSFTLKKGEVLGLKELLPKLALEFDKDYNLKAVKIGEKEITNSAKHAFVEDVTLSIFSKLDVSAQNPKVLVDRIDIFGGTINGKVTRPIEEQIIKILNGDEDVIVEVSGPQISIVMVCESEEKDKLWKRVKVGDKTYERTDIKNGKIVELEDLNPNDPADAEIIKNFGTGIFNFTAKIDNQDHHFTSALVPPPFNLAKNATQDIHIEIEGDKETAHLRFKIKRNNEKVDIPAHQLLVSGKEVITESGNLPMSLFNEDPDEPEVVGGDPAIIEVFCKSDLMESMTINGGALSTQVKQSKDKFGQDVWSIEGSLTNVSGSQGDGGTVAKLLITPKSKEDYLPLNWTFKVIYQKQLPVEVNYEFNGKTRFALPDSFVDPLEDGGQPTLIVDGDYLNIKLQMPKSVDDPLQGTFINIELEDVSINEKTFSKQEIEDTPRFYVVKHSIKLEDSNEKDVIINVEPKGHAFIKNTLRLKAKKSGTKQKIAPHFEQISGEENLPKVAFLDALTSSTPPVFATSKASADIVIYVSEYEKEFLLKEVKINDKKINLIEEPISLQYKVEESVALDTTEKLIKVEFIAQDGKADNLVWQFKAKTGGSLPSLPPKTITELSINGVGVTREYATSLQNGTNPTYTFDGKQGTTVVVKVGCYDENAQKVEKVDFQIDGGTPSSVPLTQDGFLSSATYTFTGLTVDTTEHPVKITIIPQEKEKYSPIVYEFKLQYSGKLPELPLIFAIDRVGHINGYKATVLQESAALMVQANAAIMKDVKIGEENAESPCEIKTYNIQGDNVWEAEKDVVLPNGVEKTFCIKVTPQDSNEYRETVCKFILTGTTVPNTNAEFVHVLNGGVPQAYVLPKIEWKPEFAAGTHYADDYGAMAVSFKASTVSPRAKVFAQLVNPRTSTNLQGVAPIQLTNDGKGTHTGRIELLSDKPTMMKLYVVAEDGVSKNEKKGVWWSIIYNPCPLKWGYENLTTGEAYNKFAYDSIKINKQSVKKDKKIYLVFMPWNEDAGYIVDNDNLPPYQSPSESLGKASFQQYYKIPIDVSELLSGAKEELEATLKMKKDGKECFLYKVKIGMKK